MRVGFIGAGGRMQRYYMPVIQALQEIEAVGFWTRSDETAAAAEAATGIRRYTDVTSLDADVDCLIVCVPAHALDSVVIKLYKETRGHLLIETPVMAEVVAQEAWDAMRDRRRIVCAAENWPFRPMELLKRQVVQSGILGQLNTVVNDFRGYEYHGIAMMRAYAGSAFPRSVFGLSWSTGDVDFTSSEGEPKLLRENWDVGVVELESGHRLIHTFDSVHSRTKARGPRSLRAMCTRGCVSTGTRFTSGVDEPMFDFSYIDAGGLPKSFDVRYEDDVPGYVLRASIKVDGRDEEFWYTSPLIGNTELYNEQHISTAELLLELKTSIEADDYNTVPYPAWQSWVDWLCVMGMRRSGALNQRLNVPRPRWMR